MRSAITHSGKSEVDYQNLQKSLGYARAVLSTLLSNAAFKDLKHVSDIYDLLKNAKYSCKSF
jgi:hypothetical protein